MQIFFDWADNEKSNKSIVPLQSLSVIPTDLVLQFPPPR
jgi:hypothetical protein